MKNKAVLVLKLMTILVIILIGILIWLFLNQSKPEKTIPPKESVIKEENLDVNHELVKNLSYPRMYNGCNKIDHIGRYGDNELKIENIELSEKIDTAYKAFATLQEESISSETMRQYVQTYWGTIQDYKDFTFSMNDVNYIYDEEEKIYHIESNENDICEETTYMKRFQPIILTATKKEKQIIVDYVLLYYIEDSSSGTSVIYHIYQDKEFTLYLDTVKNQDDLNKNASKYQSKLEHYIFTFDEGPDGKYYFKNGNRTNTVKSLDEIPLSEQLLENINMLTLDNACIDFTENHMYQKDRFSLESFKVSDRLLLAFYHSYKTEAFHKEGVELDDGIEYQFTEEEVKDIYEDFWGEALKSELEEFEQFHYQGILESDQYRFIISKKENVCTNTRKYVETKLDNVYQKGDTIYLDYKIRFIDQKGNTLDIYQDKNYEISLKANLKGTNISEEYWDLNYVTYRYVFKKYDDGKYYFLEGLYI